MQLTQACLETSSLPESILNYLQDAVVLDSSCSERARTFCIRGKESYFLKIDHATLLDREQALLKWLYPYGFAPVVVEYEVWGELGYLLTRALPGEDGISPGHLKQPEKLAILMGESLARLHALPILDCPYPERNMELLAEAEDNIRKGIMDSGIIGSSFQEAASRFYQLRSLPLERVYIHGDFCLPNIIIRDWQLSGFVDLGTGGVADPHYDLFWGIWTLKYNLKTPAFGDIFLEAYGKSRVDNDRLELCALIAAFTL